MAAGSPLLAIDRARIQSALSLLLGSSAYETPFAEDVLLRLAPAAQSTGFLSQGAFLESAKKNPISTLLQWLLSVAATSAIPMNPNYGFLSGYGAGPFINVISSNVYYPVTGYVASLANGTVTANKAAGTLRIGTAGTYRVSFSVSSTGGSNDQIESDVAVNGVPSDVIAGHGSSANNVDARSDCVSGQGLLVLNAGDLISVMARNIDGTTLTISHVQLAVGTA
jgi:hypothetical protein